MRNRVRVYISAVAGIALVAALWLFGPSVLDRVKVFRALVVAFSDRAERVELTDAQWEMFVRRVAAKHKGAFRNYEIASSAEGSWKDAWKSEGEALAAWNALLDVWQQRGDERAAQYIMMHIASGRASPFEQANFDSVKRGIEINGYGYLHGARRSVVLLGQGEFDGLSLE